MFMFKGKVMFCKIRKDGNAYYVNLGEVDMGGIKFDSMCQPNMATNQGGNDGWDIPENERYVGAGVITRPGNIDTYMAQEISYGYI